jgi:hypothetical protein
MLQQQSLGKKGGDLESGGPSEALGRLSEAINAAGAALLHDIARETGTKSTAGRVARGRGGGGGGGGQKGRSPGGGGGGGGYAAAREKVDRALDRLSQEMAGGSTPPGATWEVERTSRHDPSRQPDRRNELPDARPDPKKPMNIVLFYTDDWTMKTLGVLNKAVKTHNIDEMARRGMLFRKNCVTTSICWQSRATLMTGLYVAVHKQLRIGDDHMFNRTVYWPHTLFPLLKRAGYHVGYYGKWHAPMPREAYDAGFHQWDNYYGTHAPAPLA